MFEGTRSKLPYPNRVISSIYSLPYLSQFLIYVLAFFSLFLDCETFILTKCCFTIESIRCPLLGDKLLYLYILSIKLRNVIGFASVV